MSIRDRSWNRNNWKGTEWNGKVWEGDPFQPDPDIPAGERNELSDFSRSGYQRGHLCASADRLFSMDANGQTFYLSNMSPQMGSFNSPNWSDLETQVRNWGRNNNFRDTLFVVKGGTIRDDQIIEYIGGKDPSSPTKVAVPKYYFMALLCKKYDGGQNTYKAIGFWVEHKRYGTTPSLRTWAVSIDELEEKTGIDFFCNLYSVCCSTFSDVVSYNPDVYTAFYAFVTANTADEYFIMTCCVYCQSCLLYTSPSPRDTR